jgi:predicted Zn-dependent protease
LDDLEPCSCEKLLSKKGIPRPVESDPKHYELERSLGLALTSRVLAEKKLVTDAAVDDYVNKVGMAVALHSSRYDLSWRFVVFEEKNPKVLAIPGGFVMLSDGLLKQLEDESELAGVLGSAIAHILLDHGAKELKSALKDNPDQLIAEAHRLLHKDHPLKQQVAADALGTVLSACAGYDPTALTRVIQRTDPKAKLRLARLLKLIRSAKLKGGKQLKERFEKIASL